MDTPKINAESENSSVTIEISTIITVNHFSRFLYYCQPYVSQGLAAVLFYIIYNRYEKNHTNNTKKCVKIY